jgi:non-specific protein-tyrosine kinase
MSDRQSAPSTAAPAAAEAYRILRSSVKFAAAERPLRAVLVVDVDRPTPSGVAEQLALAFARAGDRCAYVATTGASSDGAGFAELLAGSVEPSVVQRPGSTPTLSIVSPGAALDPDALASERFTTALDALLTSNEYVVFACASLPTHGDALAIAPRVDATILVVTSGQTRRPRAIEARDSLQRVGANLLGVVLVEAKRRWFW